MELTERRRRASEEAAAWWLELQGREISRQQREAFVDWLRESPVHVAEMLRVASVHGALEQFENWARIVTEDAASEDHSVVSLRDGNVRVLQKRRRLPGKWLAAAAVAGLAVATALLLPALRGQVMQTDRGERREVVLADGSVVQIDPESRLRVRFEERARRVVLDSGRAVFHVAKNPQRPFLVEADATTVRAVGTAFGVERRAQGVIVTVSEGKVSIESREPAAARVSQRPPAAGGNASRIFLEANEQVTVVAGGSATPVRKVDSARALSWAEGRLNFENTPVSEVVAQFNRYNSIQMHIDDQELARRQVSGVFNAANPESFIAFLEATASVRVERDSDGDIVITGER